MVDNTGKLNDLQRPVDSWDNIRNETTMAMEMSMLSFLLYIVCHNKQTEAWTVTPPPRFFLFVFCLFFFVLLFTIYRKETQQDVHSIGTLKIAMGCPHPCLT